MHLVLAGLSGWWLAAVAGLSDPAWIDSVRRPVPLPAPSLAIYSASPTARVKPFPGEAIWTTTAILSVEAREGQRWSLSVNQEPAGDSSGAVLRVRPAASSLACGAGLGGVIEVRVGATPSTVLRGAGSCPYLPLELIVDAPGALRPGSHQLRLVYTVESEW